MFSIRRREFITLLGGAAFSWPLKVRAQQAAVPVIGYLSGRSPDAEASMRTPILAALEEAGADSSTFRTGLMSD